MKFTWMLVVAAALWAQNAVADGFPVSRADCTAEQKALLDLHAGGYYQQVDKHIDEAIRMINSASLKFAADYQRDIQLQRNKAEKVISDHIRQWGNKDVPQGPRLQWASDTLHICFAMKKQGTLNKPAPEAFMANWKESARKTNEQLAVSNKAIEDFLKSPLGKDIIPKTQAIMWSAEQTASIMEQYCSTCPNRQFEVNQANSLFVDAKNKCLENKGTAEICRPIAPDVLQAAANNPSSLPTAQPGAAMTAQRPTAGSTSSGLSGTDCEARKKAIAATKIPPGTSITSSTESVMYMTKAVIEMIDSGCPGGTPAQRAAERQQQLQAFNAAESACNSVQSGGRQCVPCNHFGPRTPGSCQQPVNSRLSVDTLVSRCSGEIQAAANAHYELGRRSAIARTGVYKGMSQAEWLKEQTGSAREFAHIARSSKPDSWRAMYNGHKEEAEVRAKAPVRIPGTHDPFVEVSLMNACIFRQLMEAK